MLLDPSSLPVITAYHIRYVSDAAVENGIREIAFEHISVDMRREERHGIHAAGITTRRGCKQLLGLRGAHLLQVGKTGGIHHLPPERFERRGILVGSNEAPHAAAALDYGTSDHIARQRRCDQILDARRAGALPHKRYVVGVAAEGRYIAPDPPQSSYLVESAVVARAAVAALGRELGVRQKASRAQTVVERYQNYIPPRPLLAVTSCP